MITVQVPVSDRAVAEAVTAVLDELVLAYRVEDAEGSLAIVDGQTRIEEADLSAYLDDLRQFVSDWHKYQVDACYIEDDGSIC